MSNELVTEWIDGREPHSEKKYSVCVETPIEGHGRGVFLEFAAGTSHAYGYLDRKDVKKVIKALKKVLKANGHA